MSRFHGQQDFTGPKNGRKNKGVKRLDREIKRLDADQRNARTPYERTARYRREPHPVNPSSPRPHTPQRPTPPPAPRPQPQPRPRP